MNNHHIEVKESKTHYVIRILQCFNLKKKAHYAAVCNCN